MSLYKQKTSFRRRYAMPVEKLSDLDREKLARLHNARCLANQVSCRIREGNNQINRVGYTLGRDSVSPIKAPWED